MGAFHTKIYLRIQRNRFENKLRTQKAFDNEKYIFTLTLCWWVHVCTSKVVFAHD